jgi:hypothetical protein
LNQAILGSELIRRGDVSAAHQGQSRGAQLPGLVKASEDRFDGALPVGFVCRIQVESLVQLDRLAREGYRHLAVAQERGTLAPLAGIRHRPDIYGFEEIIVANSPQRFELGAAPCEAFRESHEMYDAELEVGLPGSFHGEVSGEW